MNEKKYTGFESNLKIASGEVVANGLASVTLKKEEITFVSEYIPIYKEGSPMEVARIFQNKEVHIFSGRVLLSTRKVLKLGSVSDLLLEGSELCYGNDITLKGSTTITRVQQQNLLKRMFHSVSGKKKLHININIFNISSTGLTFSFFSDFLSEEKGFYKNTNHPDEQNTLELLVGEHYNIAISSSFPITEIPVEVVQVYHFGNQSNFKCNITDQSIVDTLQSYLAAYHMETNICFKDI